MALISSLYDSDDIDGLGAGRPYRWDSIFESYDAHRDITLDLTDYACEAIAQDLIPLNASFVAGLYARFLHAIGESVPGLYVARLTVDQLEVLDDTDPLGSGEIFVDVKLGPEGKRIDRLGQYDLDDHERTGIGREYSFVVGDDDSIELELRVFDDDSWWLEPDATESLGSVSDEIPPSEWTNWIDRSVSFTKRSSNGRAVLDYRIEVLPAITEDTGRRPPLRYSARSLPPLMLNIDSFCLHKPNCFCVQRMLEANKVSVFMFAAEATPQRMVELSEKVADPRLAARLRRGTLHRCGHCYVA
jgi:hypothetical protein